MRTPSSGAARRTLGARVCIAIGVVLAASALFYAVAAVTLTARPIAILFTAPVVVLGVVLAIIGFREPAQAAAVATGEVGGPSSAPAASAAPAAAGVPGQSAQG
ncbi:hypothetical protein CLV46_1818 [Diaminobutyricimonas aerilata]|uniref:Uncharacterized protein n=1 Tax=Diaminobutyricimonas aerilata TaxID=1162967 RepID=A0A2M9CK27_9MICO|nr:hypothetical protein CLV46_1818 [Diaminobutyricimonas aerilata]